MNKNNQINNAKPLSALALAKNISEHVATHIRWDELSKQDAAAEAVMILLTDPSAVRQALTVISTDDPALLVDLAIEAGGLEHPESVFEVCMADDGHPLMRQRSDLYERVDR